MESTSERKTPGKSSKKAANAIDVYVTSRLSQQAHTKLCNDILSAGEKEIYLHCLGNAINRGLNLAMSLVSNYKNLCYTIKTSTLRLIDERHPLYNSEDIEFHSRNNSVVHIRIWRQDTNKKENLKKS